MLFALEPDQERQEEKEDDLNGIVWQPAVEIHSRLRLLEPTSLAQYEALPEASEGSLNDIDEVGVVTPREIPAAALLPCFQRE